MYAATGGPTISNEGGAGTTGPPLATTLLDRQQLEKDKHNFEVAPPEKFSADARRCTDSDLILGS